MEIPIAEVMMLLGCTALLMTWGMQANTDETKLRAEIAALEERAVVWALLRRLALTEDQARTLLGLAKKAAVMRADYDAQMAKLRDEQVKAFGAFREEDIRNVGFTPKVEGAAAQAEHREKVVFKRYADRVTELEKEAALTDEQRELLAQLRADNLAILFAERKAAPLPPEILNFVRKLRRLSEAEFAAKKDQLRNEALRVAGARTSEIEDLPSFLAQVGKAMEQIRALPEDRVESDVPRIIAKVRPQGRAERLRDELGKIHQDEYGSLSALGKFLTLPATVEALSKRFGLKAEGKPTPTGGAT